MSEAEPGDRRRVDRSGDGRRSLNPYWFLEHIDSNRPPFWYRALGTTCLLAAWALAGLAAWAIARGVGTNEIQPSIVRVVTAVLAMVLSTGACSVAIWRLWASSTRSPGQR